jgi:hypothetical protein
MGVYCPVFTNGGQSSDMGVYCPVFANGGQSPYTGVYCLSLQTVVRARTRGCIAASYKAYQLLVHGRWFSPGTPPSSTTKGGRHDIADILLKVALSTINQIKSIILHNM